MGLVKHLLSKSSEQTFSNQKSGGKTVILVDPDEIRHYHNLTDTNYKFLNQLYSSVTTNCFYIPIYKRRITIWYHYMVDMNSI